MSEKEKWEKEIVEAKRKLSENIQIAANDEYFKLVLIRKLDKIIALLEDK